MEKYKLAVAIFNKQYDAIMCGFCLPYLSKEESIKLIGDASKLLKLDGLFYLSTMEDDYNNSGLRKGSSGDEIFMHYHQADYLTTTLEENHFKILNLSRKVYPAQEGTTTTDLLIIAVKKERCISTKTQLKPC